MSLVLDCGFMRRDAAGRLIPIYLADGSIPRVPVLHDGNGGVLPRGKPPVYVIVDDTFIKLGLARNSAGVAYTPLVPWWLN
mgnify:CR=1 FL=1